MTVIPLTLRWIVAKSDFYASKKEKNCTDAKVINLEFVITQIVTRRT